MRFGPEPDLLHPADGRLYIHTQFAEGKTMQECSGITCHEN
jgi:hypothetical protein